MAVGWQKQSRTGRSFGAAIRPTCTSFPAGPSPKCIPVHTFRQLWCGAMGSPFLNLGIFSFEEGLFVVLTTQTDGQQLAVARPIRPLGLGRPSPRASPRRPWGPVAAPAPPTAWPSSPPTASRTSTRRWVAASARRAGTPLPPPAQSPGPRPRQRCTPRRWPIPAHPLGPAPIGPSLCWPWFPPPEQQLSVVHCCRPIQALSNTERLPPPLASAGGGPLGRVGLIRGAGGKNIDVLSSRIT